MTQPYSAAELARIRNGYSKGQPLKTIAAALGRSELSVRVKAHKLRRAGRLPWTLRRGRGDEAELARLIALNREGKSPMQIAVALGRSYPWVISKRQELNDSGRLAEDS
jgi:DNA-binding CsgD family transcriptional regulator